MLTVAKEIDRLKEERANLVSRLEEIDDQRESEVRANDELARREKEFTPGIKNLMAELSSLKAAHCLIFCQAKAVAFGEYESA